MFLSAKIKIMIDIAKSFQFTRHYIITQNPPIVHFQLLIVSYLAYSQPLKTMIIPVSVQPLSLA